METAPIVTHYLSLETSKAGLLQLRHLNPVNSNKKNTRRRSSLSSVESIDRLKRRLTIPWRSKSHASKDDPCTVPGSRCAGNSLSSTTSAIFKLPIEVLTQILLQVDNYMSVLEFTSACQLFHTLFHNDDSLWRSLLRRRLAFSHDTYPAPFRKCRELCQDYKVLERRWHEGRDTVANRLQGHTSSIYTLLHLDPNTLVSGGRDRAILVWDMDSLRCVHRIHDAHNASVLCLATDGNVVVSGSSDGTCAIWSRDTWTVQQRIDVSHSAILDVCCGAAWIGIATGAHIYIWRRDPTGLYKQYCDLSSGFHTRAVNAIDMVDDSTLVSASADGVVAVWDVHTGERRWASDAGTSLACVRGVKDIIYAGGQDGRLEAYKADSGKVLWTSRVSHLGVVRAVDCFQDKYLATGGYDKTMRVWDAGTGKCMLTLQQAHEGPIFNIAMSRTRIISGGQDKSMMVVDFANALHPSIRHL